MDINSILAQAEKQKESLGSWQYQNLPDYAKIKVDEVFTKIDQMVKDKNGFLEKIKTVSFFGEVITFDKALELCETKIKEEVKMVKRSMLYNLKQWLDKEFGIYAYLEDHYEKIWDKDKFLAAYYSSADVTDIADQYRLNLIKFLQSLYLDRHYKTFNGKLFATNNKVKLPTFEMEWYNKGTVSTDGQRAIIKLFKTLCYFDGVELDIDNWLEQFQYSTREYYTDDFQISESPSLKSVKFDKSGNVYLNFISEEQKINFLKYIDIWNNIGKNLKKF